MNLIPASLTAPPGLAELLHDLGNGENGFMGTKVASGEVALEAFLQTCCDGTDPARIPAHLVPQTIFWLLDDDGRAVGMVKVRHRLNDNLLVRGGHIGYFIHHDHRQKGYGKEALRLALLELRKLGQARALITIHPDNFPSIRVVEANGGRLEDERVDPETGIHHKRFWIDLSSNVFKIGVESTLPAEDWWCTIYGRFLGEGFTPEIFRRSLHELGAQFTLFYDSLAPRQPDACQRITGLCEETGIDYLFNNTYGDIYGPWVPGTGRAEYPDNSLAHAAQGAHFKGIVLDEVEHRQIHQNDCGKDGPYLADVKGKTLPECYESVLATVTSMAKRHETFGAATVAEMVFPVMAPVFARAGIVPAPKFLSESFPAVFFAICAGAARQYGTELWIVHDFWSVEPFWNQVVADSFAPGCSPDAYRSSLLLSYWLGADATYTEALHNLISLRRLSSDEIRLMKEHPVGHRRAKDLEWLLTKPYSLNAYGKIHRWFAAHYVPGHPRSYTFRDIQPRIAIVRFPDTCWIAPGDPAHKGWFKGLYGPGGPASAPRHTAWLDLWHILTHGIVPRGGVSLFCAPYGRKWVDSMGDVRQNPDDYKYQEVMPFCPLDGVLVFDHLAGSRELAGADLIVLTGELISEATQQAALAEMERGADGLALPHLLPGALVAQAGPLPALMPYGKGRLLVADDFTHEAVVQFVQRHRGSADSIRYRFGQSQITLSPCDCGHGLHVSRDGDRVKE